MKNTKQKFHQSVYISDDEITRRIWTAYFVHWCDLLQARWKYDGFRSNFGLGQYDVTTVQ